MEIIEVPLQRKVSRNLNMNLCLAQDSNTYSLALEYIQKWFICKFEDGYFKSIYIDSKHILDDHIRLKDIQKLKRLKPSLAIVGSIDSAFNNEMVDSEPYGLDTHIPRGYFKNSFLKDNENNIFLGLGMKLNFMSFNFKILLSTRANQLEVYNYMKRAYRYGYTQGEDITIDYAIPNNLILKIAKDLGFIIENNKVKDVTGFLSYMNTHSDIPILYKFSHGKGVSEFFMRASNIYIHINNNSLDIGDGEREGHLYTNFEINMTVDLRFPSPSIFSYYSKHSIENLNRFISMDINTEGAENIIVDSMIVNIPDVPLIDENKWEQYITTDYIENNLNGDIEIDFSELFVGDFRKVISVSIDSNINPQLFINMKIFNDGKEMEILMNWNECIALVKGKRNKSINNIVIYADNKHINNTLISLDKLYDSRID